MRLPFFPYILSFFPLTFTIRFSYLRTQFSSKISLLRTISSYITFKIAKYYQPKQYANYQPTALAFLTFYQRAVHNYYDYHLLRRKQWKRTITQSYSLSQCAGPFWATE